MAHHIPKWYQQDCKPTIDRIMLEFSEWDVDVRLQGNSIDELSLCFTHRETPVSYQYGHRPYLYLERKANLIEGGWMIFLTRTTIQAGHYFSEEVLRNMMREYIGLFILNFMNE